MRRSTDAARSARRIQSEVLENRRLFASMPLSYGGHGDGHAAFAHHAGGPRGPGPDIMVISLPLGGFMRAVSDGASTTAYSSNYAFSGNDSTRNGPSDSARAVRSAATPRATEAIAAAMRNAVPTPAAATPTSATPLVQQVLPDAMTAATAAAPTATSGQWSATANLASESVFGPFTLGPIRSDSGTTESSQPLGSLLTLDPDAVDRSLRWQSQDATYRPKRAASPTAEAESGSLELAARAAMHVQQATIAPMPAELADRPLWQRVATVAAAGLLVVTNTIVRRRQRRAALAVHR